MKINKHYLYAIITIPLWGTSSIAIVSLLEDMTGLQALTFCFLFASVTLFLIAWKQGKLNQIKSYRIKDYVIIFALSGFGIFLYNILVTYSYVFATGTEAVAINYLWPIWIIIFSVFILKERLTKRKALATAISFLGMLLIVTRGDFADFAQANIFGVCLCFFGSICFGLFNVIVKKLPYDKTLSMMLYFAGAALIGLIGILCFSSFPHLTLKVSLWLLLRGVGQFGLAYFLWVLALMGDTVKISNLALVTPFLQLVTLVLFKNEATGIIPLFGLICIVVGIIISRESATHPIPHPADADS